MNATHSTPQIHADQSATDNVAALEAYYDAWSRQDPEAVVSFFTEESVFDERAFEARFAGLEQIRGFVDLTYVGAPDFVVKPTRIVANGDDLAAEWVMTGTHSGDMAGMPATNKSFEVRAVSFVKMAAGRIVHIEDYWNPVEFQRNVGLI